MHALWTCSWEKEQNRAKIIEFFVALRCANRALRRDNDILMIADVVTSRAEPMFRAKQQTKDRAQTKT